MAKKLAGQPHPRAVDCEKCRHFTGRNDWSAPEWGCAKGHARMPGQEYSLMRLAGCKDFAALSRDEQIFRRFRLEAEQHGDATLKNKRALARRTATSLGRALAEFGPVMDTEQVAVGKAAVQALLRLAEDIERAGKLAVSHKAKADVQRHAADQARHVALVAKHLASADGVEILACAKDLIAFADDDVARRWLALRKGGRTYTGLSTYELQAHARALDAAKDRPAQVLAARALQVEVAEMLEQLGQARPADFADRTDFEAFRLWRREQTGERVSGEGAVPVAAARKSVGKR